jgi:two-component system, OmpR family, sensor kinase
VRTRLPVRLKLAIVTAGLTFGILCLFAVVIGAVAEQRIRNGFDDDLRATVADLTERLDPRVEDGQLDITEESLVGAQTGGALVRLVLGGQVVFPNGAAPLGAPSAEGIADVGEYRVISRALTISTRDPAQRFNEPLSGESVATDIGFVQYAKPEAGLTRTINKVRLFLGFGVLGGTVLAFFGGLFVAERAMRPIASLTHASREVARTRDPDVTLPKPRANDEVSDLAHTLEDMLRELTAARGETEATLARQREFVADASHELRTPLTSILANLELLESELGGEQREMAESALRSSRRMRRLVADLLLLARADAGRQAPHAPVDLSAVAREAVHEAGAVLRAPALARPARPGQSHRSGRRPSPPGGQPGGERAASHAARDAGHGVRAVRGRLRGARGCRPRAGGADRAAPAGVRALRERRRGRGTRRRERPGSGDREGGGRRSRRPGRAPRRAGRRRALRGHPAERDARGGPLRCRGYGVPLLST